MVAALLMALSVLAPPAAAQLPAPPVVGEGPLQVGGFAAVTFTRPEHPEEVERPEVSELAAALLAWGRLAPAASYLVELDVAKRTTETWTGREVDQRLAPVRLYLEYAFDPLLRLRAGRFLTPVGQWNERHAEPLTWTPTRPLTTYRPFAKSLTGLLVAGDGGLSGRDWGYALYWAPAAELEEHDEEESGFVRALGGRAALELRPGLTLGASLATVRRSRPAEAEENRDEEGENREEAWEDREEDAGSRALLGGDLRWERPGLELAVEAVWVPRRDGIPAEAGAFASVAVRLVDPLWAVARAETYRPLDGRAAHLGFAGLTLRAHRRLVVKLGRQFSEQPSSRIPDGWFLSFSSLF